MNVFCHHIYEYKKGLRNLVLLTAARAEREKIEERLRREKLAYLVRENGHEMINVFFGNRACISVLQTFETGSLSKLTHEQDFMLGIMLGYDRLRQCDRYLKRQKNAGSVEDLIG